MLMICWVTEKIEERNRRLRFGADFFLRTLRFVIVFLFFRLIFWYYYGGFIFSLNMLCYFVMNIIAFTVIT
jgi:hypothetical protein